MHSYPSPQPRVVADDFRRCWLTIKNLPCARLEYSAFCQHRASMEISWPSQSGCSILSSGFYNMSRIDLSLLNISPLSLFLSLCLLLRLFPIVSDMYHYYLIESSMEYAFYEPHVATLLGSSDRQVLLSAQCSVLSITLSGMCVCCTLVTPSRADYSNCPSFPLSNHFANPSDSYSYFLGGRWVDWSRR